MDDPFDSGLPPEVLDEFYEASKQIAKVCTAQGLGEEGEQYAIGEKCETNTSIDLLVLDYERIGPDLVLKIAPGLRAVLRSFHHYWVVRVVLSTTGGDPYAADTAIWLEIDRYDISQYNGKKSNYVFQDMPALYNHYWKRSPTL